MISTYSWGRAVIIAFLAIVFFLSLSTQASAATNCVFSTSGTTMTLAGNCTTDATIFIPNGFTLDGKNFTITAKDPSGDHFRGAVVKNAGTVAHVKNLWISAGGLLNVCDAGDDRLRGILFEGASGSITNSAILVLHQGASGCQEGNGIEVRNEPFDGTHPNTQSVDIISNLVMNYQKTGIVVNGDVNAFVRSNYLGRPSATQANLAANGIQFGFGAFGNIWLNTVAGNQWCGPSNFAATALLLFETGGAIGVNSNTINGNSDVGIYVFGDNITVFANKVYDTDPRIVDCNVNGYDIGIGNYGSNNSIISNTVLGFNTPYDPPLTTTISLQSTGDSGQWSGNDGNGHRRYGNGLQNELESLLSPFNVTNQVSPFN